MLLAPIIAVFSVLMVWAVVPFSEKWFGADLSVGIMYIAAVGSFGIVAVMMALEPASPTRFGMSVSY